MTRVRLAGALVIVLAAFATTAAAAPASRHDNGGRVAAARATKLCGTVNIPNRKKDARYYAHNVRCKKARRVAKWFVGTGPKVRGWVCAVSLGRCYEGSFESRRYVRFPYHVVHPGQPIYRTR